VDAGELVGRLGRVVGDRHVLVDPSGVASYATDWTGRFHGRAMAVVRPASAEDVADVVRLCAAARVAVVPQGGNTGLVGGSVPRPVGAQVVLSTRRLTAIGDVDVADAQLAVGAGVTLADAQAAAATARFEVGVDLGARDSCTVGGMVATNAGGIHVLRNGMMRAGVAGLEVVLADGSVVRRMDGLRKDTAGYDLPGLLCGSEGTLGIVTRVLVRLVPEPLARVTALLGVGSAADAVAVVGRLAASLPGLEAAEVCWADGLALVHGALGVAPVLADAPPVVLLVEAGAWSPRAAAVLLDEIADAVAACPEVGATAVADDAAGRARLWAGRERHTEAIATLGIPHKLDVAVPRARLAAFEAAVRERVAEVAPGSRCVLFGHVGDGNLHVNVVGPDPDDESVDDAVLHVVAAHGGTVSAEHGIGVAKARWLHLCRGDADIAAMRAVKAALDPAGVLNPGVLL
jgi:FAD/FMN-containing dehydrogenase